MTLYLYRIGAETPMMAIENVISYTADQAVTADGTVYGPFAEDCELSATENCAGTLRADWRAAWADPETVTLVLLADHEERLCMMELMTL